MPLCLEVVPPPDPRPRQGQERATSAAKPPPKRGAGEGDIGAVASKEFEAGEDGFVFVDDVLVVEVSVVYEPRIERPCVGCA